MPLSQKLRSGPPEEIVGWRARRIDNPVEKLSYLKRAMQDRPIAPGRPLWMRVAFGVLVVAGFALMLPTPHVVSEVPPLTSRERAFPEHAPHRSPAYYANVWLVEEAQQHELYSNGLRIDTSLAVESQKRFYRVLSRKNQMQPSPEWRSEPAGIVFHTTESSLAPFEQVQNDNLQRLAKGLLALIQERRSYNYVIDRFGRVYRIVEDGSAANHAGNSIWASADDVYLNLNSSFIGVAFEAQTENSEAKSMNRAQVYAGRMLTEMLRSKHRIDPANCITHAQVSVNPANMLIGYHTDWSRGLPFNDLGLPNNYDAELSSILDFGFDYDALFRRSHGKDAWKGLTRSEERFQLDAARHGRSSSAHRSALQDRYRRLYTALRLTGDLSESSDVSKKQP